MENNSPKGAPVSINTNKISSHSQDLIEKFLSAYNSIEKFLRIELNENNDKGFKGLIVEYLFKYPRLKFLNDLRTFVDLRNSLVHGRTRPYMYLAVPLPEIVHSIEDIRDKLINPEKVLPRFQKKVTTVQIDDTLLYILKLINEHHYSQFPVYDNNNFKGLVTENVITQWLAKHINNNSSDIDFKQIQIKDILIKDDKKNNCFISRDTTLEQLISIFSNNLLLEAAFISHNGKPDQGLLGIVTVSDIIELLDE